MALNKVTDFNPGDYVLCRAPFKEPAFTAGKVYKCSGICENYSHLIGIEFDDQGTKNGWSPEYFINLGPNITKLEEFIYYGK